MACVVCSGPKEAWGLEARAKRLSRMLSLPFVNSMLTGHREGAPTKGSEILKNWYAWQLPDTTSHKLGPTLGLAEEVLLSPTCWANEGLPVLRWSGPLQTLYTTGGQNIQRVNFNYTTSVSSWPLSPAISLSLKLPGALHSFTSSGLEPLHYRHILGRPCQVYFQYY